MDQFYIIYFLVFIKSIKKKIPAIRKGRVEIKIDSASLRPAVNQVKIIKIKPEIIIVRLPDLAFFQDIITPVIFNTISMVSKNFAKLKSFSADIACTSNIAPQKIAANAPIIFPSELKIFFVKVGFLVKLFGII